MIKVAILTISDRGSRGERADTSGDVLATLSAEIPAEVAARQAVADEKAEIIAALHDLSGQADIVFTTGGTGIAERDVTPEATREVIDRELSGFGELMRVKGYESTPRSILSRAIAGVCGTTLIVNMPGSTAAVRECFEVLLPSLKHAVEILHGTAGECGRS